jgi:signal transduction histidine kinase
MPASLPGHPGVFSLPVLRRLLAVFAPLALFTGCVVLALYYQDRAKGQALYEQAGSHLVGLHADIIARELRAVESDLLYLAGQASLSHYLADGPSFKEEIQGDYLLFCRQRAVYDQVRFLDTDGRERVRVNFNDGRPAVVPESELQPKAERYYFVEAMHLDRGEVFVSPFDLNVEHGQIEQPPKPTLRFATPVFDARGTKRGVLVLNYLGAALFRKLAEVSATFPGTALLLNREGHYLRGPTPESEWGFMLGHGQTFAADHPAAWARLNGAEGQFLLADGLFTYRALSLHRAESVTGTELVVVSHVPPAVLGERSEQLLRRLLLLYAVVILVLMPLAWYLAFVGSVRRAHERQLEESEARLRTLSAQLLTAQEEERRGLARDLHDEMGQVVTAVTLDLQRAGQAAEPARKDELITRALRGTGCLLDRIHEISARVRPLMLDDLGLKAAVQDLLSDYERRTGVGPVVELRLEHQDVPAAISENTYRILQEALTNVARHAQATELFVGLYVTANQVGLIVRDNGVGFEPATLDGKRLGILGMRERAELLNGTFAVRSVRGKGTEIQAVLPLCDKME